MVNNRMESTLFLSLWSFWSALYKYSVGGGVVYVYVWLCMFSHWQRNDKSIILMVGLFEQQETEK